MSEELGITVKKKENFSEWYNEVVLKAQLADFSDIKGFMVVKPYGYAIWEKIQQYFDEKIKKIGHQNAYFPAVIPERFFEKEKEHVQGFSPEVFWITHAGKTELGERLALRPTSETIIYASYAQWIRSWRDLPLLINCWNSVFRAETKMTKLFLRTREFLWQEGHTAHATKEEADEEVMTILKIYRQVMEELLAIPVITGMKTESEKFAGALYTTTLEALMPDGRAIQMGTSHNLGQHFAKAFGIEFLDKNEKKQYAWQTSWGISTRLLGAITMMHGDDRGLILPPSLAPIQVVVVPIIFDKSKAEVLKKAKELSEKLSQNFSVHLDAREGYSAGFKFNEWELKGVPLRVEIGPKDIEKNQVVVYRRDTGKKESIAAKELSKKTKAALEDIQKNLYKKSLDFLNSNTHEASGFMEFKEIIEQKRGFIIANWCGAVKCEEEIKERTGATIRCLPFDPFGKSVDGKHFTSINKSGKCVFCGSDCETRVYFARAY
ncbi:MAG: proline--tRNA ligase [Candidatus Aenigmarchaeota archaeon]|nr:proline--tRNA ligase [Candidatus Aenigmarchaeota archaeon]